jgi:hypothetical protein
MVRFRTEYRFDCLMVTEFAFPTFRHQTAPIFEVIITTNCLFYYSVIELTLFVSCEKIHPHRSIEGRLERFTLVRPGRRGINS